MRHRSTERTTGFGVKIISSLTLAALLILGAASQDASEGPAAAFAAKACAACHGRDGNSISPFFPRLAGQRAQYVEAQLKSFRDKTRADPPAVAYMWGMASQLDDEMIRELAAFYESQAPHTAQARQVELLSAGKDIYEHGLSARNVPDCQSCHGAAAQGVGANPRLAGQHPEYLVKQLTFFKTRLRRNDPVMPAVCANMTFEQMEAVAVYASSR